MKLCTLAGKTAFPQETTMKARSLFTLTFAAFSVNLSDCSRRTHNDEPSNAADG